MNYARNRSFEGSWGHGIIINAAAWVTLRGRKDADPPGVQEIKVPRGWWVRYATASIKNPYWDGQPYNLFQTPEFDLKNRKTLPLAEQDLFILDGDWCVKVFGGHKAWMAGYHQSIDVPAGDVTITVPLFADLVAGYDNGGKIWAPDPRSGNIRFVVNGAVLDGWQQLIAGSHHEPTVIVHDHPGGLLKYGFDLLCPFALENSGFFIDNVSVTVKERTYDREIHLLPQDATLEETIQVVTEAYPARQSITFSLDDAAITHPNLGTRTLHAWESNRIMGTITGGESALNAWITKHYPPGPIFAWHKFESPGMSQFLLWQKDPRWLGIQFGNGYITTVGKDGCFLVDAIMARRILIDPKADPFLIRDKFTPTDFVAGTARVWYASIKSKLGIEIENVGVNTAKADAHLAAGGLAMAEVLPSTKEHYVLVYKKAGASYRMMDPLLNVDALVSDHYLGIESWRLLRKATSAPPPPPPAPPLGGEFLSLHVQNSTPDWLAFIAAVKPEWVKIVGGMERVREIKAASPGTKVLYRHHVDDQKPFYSDPDPYAAARRWIDQFRDSLITNAAVIDAVEGLNEEIPTANPDKIGRVVSFEVAFSDTLAAMNIGVAACLLNVAVGNPGHDEVNLLIPAARAAVENDHYIGYHPYFPCAPGKSGLWLETEGLHHHMRDLLSWYPVFEARGLHPKLLATECGAIGAHVRPDGRPGGYVSSGSGWRTPECLNGDWDLYLHLLLGWRAMRDEWNRSHGWRSRGAMVFTVGGPGWEAFSLDQKLAELAEALSG